MAQNVVINGVTYQNVPEVDIPKSGSGTAKFYDTASADITAGDVLTGKKAFGASGEVDGSMANNGSTSGTISTKAGTVSIPAGYTTGGTVSISSTEQNKIIASNIKNGVTILGVQGNLALPTISQDSTTKILSISEGGVSVAQNISLLGASYSAVPAVNLPKTGGGTATFTDVTDTTAAAGDVASGKYFYTAAGVRTQGTSSGGGGTDRLVLLQTTAIGALQTSSTSAADTGKTISLASTTGWANYDLLIVDISVDTKTNGRHTSTVTPVILTGTSNVSTKNTYTVGSNKWNSKLGSTGTASTRQSTTAYGVYINGASASNNTLTLTVYYRYNSNSTGTLNGTYTARVYGIKLIDLIGG